MNASREILVIDDDKDLVGMLEERLVREGFRVKKAFDGSSGYRAAVQSPSLVLLDLILPEIRGMDLCQKLKSDPKTASIPVIMLTANADDVDIVLGLELGADDYVTKPFNLRQLVARIRAVLRRTEGQPKTTLKNISNFGPLKLNHSSSEIEVDGVGIAVTKSEFEILSHLVSNAGEVVTRSDLLQILSQDGAPLVERNIDVHVGSLRKKLGVFGKLILTIRNVGYKCLREDQLSLLAH